MWVMYNHRSIRKKILNCVKMFDCKECIGNDVRSFRLFRGEILFLRNYGKPL